MRKSEFLRMNLVLTLERKRNMRFTLLRTVCFCVLAVAYTATAEPAAAQSREYCTGVCGGKPGGEAANPPSVVACFRKCMGMGGNNAGQAKKPQTR